MAKLKQSLTPQHLEYLESLVGSEHISVKPPDLDQHAKDESFHEPHRPSAVVWPHTAEEISAILQYANSELIPVTPWGAGTSLEGNPIPIYGGIVLDTLRMDQVIEIHPDDFQVVVQAGVRYKDLNEHLGRQGLFFAPDPGANASIGGMIANNASGTRTHKYGATKDNVLHLEVVTPTGEIIQTGARTSKTSSGYDLVHLFIGSEGTLGIMSQATLKLDPLPDKFSAVVASFATTQGATRTVSNIIGSGVDPAALEFLDPPTIRVLSAATGNKLPERPTLLMEFHSATQAGLEEELKLVESICNEEECLNFEMGLGRGKRDRLWEMRHQNYEILVRSHPGGAFLVMDVAVPVSRYTELMAVVEETLSKRNLQGFTVGHASDGNLHPAILYWPEDPTSHQAAREADRVIIEAAISMGGTATGEHGVGIGKRGFMELEHGKSLEVMKAIKKCLDPNGVLNPGKIFM
ncbi:MAG: FAD-binding oxidoreductase [Anaerolineales bacterium]|jgi:D-lactate dehydrogenase (cytochrome)